MAPDGCENCFILIPIAPDLEDKEEIRCLESITNAMKDNESLEMNRKIVVKEIEDIIDRSKRNKKPGPDFITNEMMKNGKDKLKKVLCNVTNNIKENKEEFPMVWKVGDVVSFNKGKGDPYNVINDRGITLTSAVLKIIENVIGERVEPEIKKNSTPLYKEVGKKVNHQKNTFLLCKL